MIEIHKILSRVGCCSSCILRYIGSKNATFYENPQSSVEKLGLTNPEELNNVSNSSTSNEEEPASKRRKIVPCVCCLGLLQEDGWKNAIQKIQNAVVESRYESDTFACALTYPISILIREHSLNLFLMEELPRWKPDCVTSLKEAWKWTFGVKLAKALNKKLDSGAVCPFLIKANVTYSEETQELETLIAMAPSVFAEREKCHRKFHGETFTKKGVEGVLCNVDPETFKQYFNCPPEAPSSWVECSSVDCTHSPIYVAGRYCKYSRELCQTPWILNGKRIMESSIQDLIFAPLVKLYSIPVEKSNHKFKFLSSGREDVDVRCIGEGRPFVVEISEPKGVNLDDQILRKLAIDMGDDKSQISVRDLQVVSKDELSILKKGEETKTKTYIALCMKLGNKYNYEHSNGHVPCERHTTGDIVTHGDISKINSYSNSENEVIIKQRTPLRVLHRRPLLIRDRTIHHMQASLIEGYPNLFSIEMTTQAGTYIKEFVHGDFGRTKPSLCDILGYKVDIIALDVKSVNLDWPRKLE